MAITETLSGHESVCTTAKTGTDLEPELHQRKMAINGKQQQINSLSTRQEITYALFETDIDSIEEENKTEVEVLEKSEEKQVTLNESPLVNGATSKKASFSLFPQRKYEYVWLNILAMIGLHVGAAVGYLLVPKAQVATLLWTYAMLMLGTLGVQAGAHRLWCHKVRLFYF